MNTIYQLLFFSQCLFIDFAKLGMGPTVCVTCLLFVVCGPLSVVDRDFSNTIPRIELKLQGLSLTYSALTQREAFSEIFVQTPTVPVLKEEEE